MKLLEAFIEKNTTRRGFIGRAVSLIALTALAPILACRDKKGVTVAQPPSGRAAKAPQVTVTGDPSARTLLKNGLIVDGSGGKSYIGDLLINGGIIETVTARELRFGGRTIDCSGLVIAPGFIDMHSHMDWVLPLRGHESLKTPFTAQGVTSFVTGNCGFGVAGYRPGGAFKNFIKTRMSGLVGMTEFDWESMDEYFKFLRRRGISHNIINLAGHGMTRTSMRGFDPSPLRPEEMTELLSLLETAMEQGARGVSLGLQYEPGVFAGMDELRAVARLVKKHDKILTVHLKAYSSLSGTYPLVPYGKDHNIIALHEMLNLARETGVRLQVSHLIFVGAATWNTCEEALDRIDRAIRDGVDVKFDTYAYHCGTSIINVFFPGWFLGKVPGIYKDRKALLRLELELRLIKFLLGFGYDDIQITNAGHPELDRYNGMFLTDIARSRKMDQFDNFIDIAQKSGGKARVLNHRYSSLDNVRDLMKHPASLFMTDATVAAEGVQNPGAFGNFPRFLQYSRDYRLLSVEDAVRKMTGASAERFQVTDRGLLKKGYAADITLFDWKKVKDNNTTTLTDRAPDGIVAVFINGKQVKRDGRVDAVLNAGMVV